MEIIYNNLRIKCLEREKICLKKYLYIIKKMFDTVGYIYIYIIIDNDFTSVSLFEKLLKENVTAEGTLNIIKEKYYRSNVTG